MSNAILAIALIITGIILVIYRKQVKLLFEAIKGKDFSKIKGNPKQKKALKKMLGKFRKLNIPPGIIPQIISFLIVVIVGFTIMGSLKDVLSQVNVSGGYSNETHVDKVYKIPNETFSRGVQSISTITGFIIIFTGGVIIWNAFRRYNFI